MPLPDWEARAVVLDAFGSVTEEHVCELVLAADVPEGSGQDFAHGT